MSGPTQRDQRLDTDPLHVSAIGAIRRMLVAFSDKVLWQLSGVRMPGGTVQTRKAEVFPGIGIYARPPSSGKPEAIALNLGADADAPVVVATRDEATRARSAGALAADETAAYNSRAIVHVKADGTVEIRGVPQLAPAEKMIKGETYRDAEDALVGALRTFSAAIGVYNAALLGYAPLSAVMTTGGPTSPASVFAGALTAFQAAIDAFATAAPGYLARVGKVE